MKRIRNFLWIALTAAFFELPGQGKVPEGPLAHTYSIVARDPETGNLAVGVQSHWFSVGTAVPWAEAGVGAVATQSFTNKSFGMRGLALLKAGLSPQGALDSLLATDEGREYRQVAIMDSEGNAAAFTGKNCIQHAGHKTGKNFSVQANMVLTGDVWRAMAKAFAQNNDLPLAERVVETLLAAEAEGGDIRGKQSAALLVVKAQSSGDPWNDRIIDLRVDDHAEPLKELGRLLRVHRAYEHMNAGDMAIEKGNMEEASEEYRQAAHLYGGENLEMQYWHAIALANNHEQGKAEELLKEIFAKDPHWWLLTKRLPAAGLLNIPEKDFTKIINLK